MMARRYKTVDTATLAGLEQAERLHLAGWTQYRVGLFYTYFYKDGKK